MSTLSSPNAIFSGGLQKKIEELLQKEDLPGFLKDRVVGEIRFHHEFKITVSDCPNACSQPQITEEETLTIVARCIAYYKSACHNGERFADLLSRDETLLKDMTGPPE